MRKKLLSMLLSVAMVLSIISTVPLAASAAPVFFDDFESYEVNTYPSTFTLQYNGTGDANQKVITTTGYEGLDSKVFQLQGAHYWSSEQYVNLPAVLPEVLIADAYIKPVSGSWPGEISFRNLGVGSWGTRYAAVWFSDSGNILAVQNGNDGDTVDIGDYTMGQWYHITLKADLLLKTFDVYIDGVKAAEDLPAHSTMAPTTLSLIAGNIGTNEIYFDEVGLYSDMSDVTFPPAAPVLQSAETTEDGETILLAFDKAMADPSGKHSQFTVTADEDSLPVEAAALDGLDDTKLQLTLGEPIFEGQTVEVSYSAGDVQAADEGLLASFEDVAVENNSTVAAPADTVLLEEDFEIPFGVYTPPAGWALSLANTWQFQAPVTPAVSAYSGSYSATFRSWNLMSGSTGRLYTTAGLDMSSDSEYTLSFRMYHDTGFASSADRIDVQVSTDGGVDWTTLAMVYRYDGSTGWKEHLVDLSDYAGNDDVRIGFNGTSAYGLNTHMDLVKITKPGSETTPPGAANAAISGTQRVGETLTGTYDYISGSDPDEGASAFRWLRVSGIPSLLGETYLLYTTNNIGGVTSDPAGPPNPAAFTVADETVIRKISNYHYGSYDTPGTISLQEEGGATYGPWDAVLDGYWRVYPDVTIPAGTYTVLDSKGDSWSFNAESGNAGMTEIVGYTVISGATESAYTLQDEDAGHALMFEVTPVDSLGSAGTAVLSSPYGPILPALPSADADLADLSASGLTLSPDFSSAATSYTASADHSKSSTTIHAAASDDGATVTINGAAGPDQDIALNVGSNEITVEVTAEDGTTTKTYTITITRAAAAHSSGGSTIWPAIVVTTEAEDAVSNRITVDPAVSSGTTNVSFTKAMADALVDKAQETGGTSKDDQLEIMVNTAAEIGMQKVSMPQDALAEIASGTEADLAVISPMISITFDGKAVDTIAGAASGGEVVITAERLADVNGRPVYDLTVTNSGKTVSDFLGGHAAVTIPYTLKPGENPNAVVIYYLADDGTLKPVRGHYDAALKAVVFKTPHFSKFTVGYNPVSFADVAPEAWYKNAVDFIAARGITSGTGERRFSPEAKLTRAQFVVLLMNAYQIGVQTQAGPNFADAGSTYYTDYLGTAKGLGIVNGIGNNRFAPEQAITRQEMFAMLHNALKVLDEVPAAVNRTELSSFTDAAQTADWAKEAMSALVKAGIVGGYDNRLHPTAATTRGEIAQVLYNLMTK
jgi:hypothetical protein